jgi:CheY-like chemotaxis protein
MLMTGNGGRRVLLVDDSAFTLSLATQVLTDAGYYVRTACSMAETKALLTQWTPEVVLTDVMMPDISGTELCRWFKSRLESILVILMSNLPPATLQQMAQRYGADGFVSKERGIQWLPREIEAICEGVVW